MSVGSSWKPTEPETDFSGLSPTLPPFNVANCVLQSFDDVLTTPFEPVTLQRSGSLWPDGPTPVVTGE